MNKKIKICLAGNPNCGKSSLFNNLTGLKQHVGNYPGVTVEKKEGTFIKNDIEINVVDLPGIYGLSASSQDEVVARNFIIEEKPEMIVNVIDSSNLERNLYLFAQLSQLNIPIIIAMNMTDILKDKGCEIDYKKLEEKYSVIAIPIIASKNVGTDNLIKAIIDVVTNKKSIKNISVDYGEGLSKEINKVKELIKEDKNLSSNFPINYLSTELIKQDTYAIEKVKTFSNSSVILEEAKKSNELIFSKFQEPLEAIFADRIYNWISKVCDDILKQIHEPKKDMSETIDKIVLNKFLAIPIFLVVMYIIFKFTFTASEPLVNLFEQAIEYISNFATKIIPEGILQSFIVDGIIAGVGGVLSFFPLILFMFFAIAFFEDTGYMARAVFIMDKFMRKFGLHGKSFASMIIATNGCAVPAMMATRTIDNQKDRLTTLMVTPFMICGAKLPIFALFIGAFFTAKQGANVMFIMYVISVILALASAWILKKTVFKGENSYFVMELPPYRRPSLKSILMKMWERGWLYIKKAGTIILLMSIIIWGGLCFPKVNEEDISKDLSEEEIASIQIENSYIGKVGNFIEPLIRPIGFDGNAGIALIAGLAAKEIVVSTLGTIYSLGEIDTEDATPLAQKLAEDPKWNKLKAITFLIFCLIYLPCIVAISVFYRETGSKIKWLLFLIVFTTILGYALSFIVYQVGLLLGFGG